MNIVGIYKGILEKLQQYPKDAFNNLKMKSVKSIFRLTFLALDMAIILLLADHSAGEAHGNILKREYISHCIGF